MVQKQFIALLSVFLMIIMSLPFVSATGLGANLQMVANPTGNMSCSSSGGDEWKMFDLIPDDANKWTETAGSDGVGYAICDFGIQVNATNASIRTGASSTRNPLAFTLEGSNDNSTWFVLHDHVNTLALDAWTDIDNLNNSGMTFRFFKINITSNEGSIFVDVVELNITDGLAAIILDTVNPTFSAVANNGTGAINGDSVNWTVTISDETELNTCYFTTNDTGTFTNVTVPSCTTPFIFDQAITVSATVGQEVCGFFGAIDLGGNTAETAQSCFTVLATPEPPQAPIPLGNAGTIVVMAGLVLAIVGFALSKKK